MILLIKKIENRSIKRNKKKWKVIKKKEKKKEN